MGGGGMPPPYFGPPPQELQREFALLKTCTIASILFVAAQASAASIFNFQLLGEFLFSQMSFYVELIFATWLLRDDEHFQKVYQFLGRTCCVYCKESCQSGMACLLPVTIISAGEALFTLIFDVLIVSNTSVEYAVGIEYSRLKTQDALFADFTYYLFWASKVLYILVFVIAAYTAYQAYKKFQGIMGTLPMRAPAAAAGDFGSGGGFGGGRFGGGGMQMERRDNRETDAPVREARPPAGFVQFSGQGHRLGS